MALPFSNTTDRTGIVQLLEDLTNTQSSTSASYPLKTKTRDINSAYVKFMMIAIDAEGRWQVDDTNQDDYPNITNDIVSGQGDYSFTVDGSTVPNQILDIWKVEIKNSDGTWVTLEPYDSMTDDSKVISVAQLETQSGTPRRYDKSANAITLDTIPDYNSTGGMRIWFTRTPVYFLSTDTTKVPGIPDMFHEYLAFRPAYFYSLAKGLPRAKEYKIEMLEMEKMAVRYFSSRQKDEIPVMKMEDISSK